MQIKCTGQDLSAILIALDFAVCMWIGQYDNIEEVMRWNKDVEPADIAGSVRPLIHRARNAAFLEPMYIGYYGSFESIRLIAGHKACRHASNLHG